MKKLFITGGFALAFMLCSQPADARIDVGINLGAPAYAPAYVEPAPVYVEQPAPAYVMAPRYDRYNRGYHYDRRVHSDHWHR